MSTLDIRLVDAALEPQLLAAYSTAQVRALSLAGYPPLRSSRTHDWDTGECALVLAFDEDSALIGGVRLQRHVSDRPMPCAEFLRAALPAVDAILDRDVADGGCGEACGLWGDPAYSGQAFVDALMLAVMSQARRWCGNWLWGHSPTRLVPYYLDVGYRVFSELGNEGGFWYADADEESWILRVEIDTLRTMPHRDLALRAQLRETGKGERASAGPRGILNFNYDLL